MECSRCEGECKCMLRQRRLTEREKYTNFSISGGACAPSVPSKGTVQLKPGIGINFNNPFKDDDRFMNVEIDKEWVKALLEEYRKTACDDYRNDFKSINTPIDEFLDKSEVWNGRG